MIGILAIYTHLKRISFCNFKFEKETDVWDNIIYLLQENNNIRWVDLHKSNMNFERPALIGEPLLDIKDDLAGCLEDVWEEGV